MNRGALAAGFAALILGMVAWGLCAHIGAPAIGKGRVPRRLG
jgi:hypothetical protein